MDTSVVMKWFKTGERYEAPARDLRQRIDRREVEAAVNEILSLEIARGLKNAQVRQPALGITDAVIENAYGALELMCQTGVLLECEVKEVKTLTKDIELTLGLFMADALHLATAIYMVVQYFVVDDHHFLAPAVVNYAASFGVQVVNLPDLLAALNRGAGAAGPSP
jgi:predicted nucleic acid-binding protein